MFNDTILIEQLFGVLLIMRGENQMSNNTVELINIIRENDNPEQALQTAIEIISSFLEQCESYQEPSPDFLQALG